MNFNSKGIKDKISSGLSLFLKQESFLYKKTRNEFVRVEGELSFIFNMLFSAWSDHYSISVRLYISHKKVEKIFEQILGKSHSLTLGNTIERITKSPDGRRVVNGDMAILLIQWEDIEAAVDTLKGYYEYIAKPYFKKYSSLEALNDIFNKPPFDYCPAHVGGALDNRCMKGLIIARLVNNPNFPELVNTYDEAIKRTMNERSIEKYYQVREFLSYNRIG